MMQSKFEGFKPAVYAKPEDYGHIKKHLEQMNRETPTITGSTYATSMYDTFESLGAAPVNHLNTRRIQAGHGGMELVIAGHPHLIFPQQHQDVIDEHFSGIIGQPMATRVVRVFILDPNESITVENRMLYTSNEKLTDLTDQELFFELPMNDILTKHNVLRAKTMDKTQTAKLGKEIFLEPVRIRDLKMAVVNIATF